MADHSGGGEGQVSPAHLRHGGERRGMDARTLENDLPLVREGAVFSRVSRAVGGAVPGLQGELSEPGELSFSCGAVRDARHSDAAWLVDGLPTAGGQNGAAGGALRAGR